MPLVSQQPSQDPGASIVAPFIAESRLLVLAYAGTVLFFVMMLCWTHRGGGSLGGGVWVMGAGCGVMVGYAITRISYVGAARYGHTDFPALYRLGDRLQVLGLGLIAIGTLIPRLGRVLTNRRRRRAYLELKPLWELVTRHVPGVVFATNPTGDAATWQLDRRVIEIQDALVILEASLPRPAVDPGHGDQASASAARLAAALATAPRSSRVVVGGAPTTDTRTRLITPPDGIDPVHWLVQVARALPESARIPDHSTEETR